MINASEAAGLYPAPTRQDAFASKIINGQQFITGNAGAFESLVSYGPRRPNPINIASNFPSYRQSSTSNQFHQNPDNSVPTLTRQETLRCLSGGFNPK